MAISHMSFTILLIIVNNIILNIFRNSFTTKIFFIFFLKVYIDWSSKQKDITALTTTSKQRLSKCLYLRYRIRSQYLLKNKITVSMSLYSDKDHNRYVPLPGRDSIEMTSGIHIWCVVTGMFMEIFRHRNCSLIGPLMKVSNSKNWKKWRYINFYLPVSRSSKFTILYRSNISLLNAA